MKYGVYNSYKLADDPFQFSGHLKSSEEYIEALRQAKKHRQLILSYSDSRRLIDAEDLGVIVLAKDYYNTVRKERPDKAKSKTIIVLLRMLEDNEFVYRTRVSIKESATGISRKLIRLFWAYRK
jgi:hypothetical protein